MPLDRTVLFRLATSSRFETAVRSVPPTAARARRAAARYVAGTSYADARRAAEELTAIGVASTIDQFGELVDDRQRARQVADDYLALARDVGSLPESAWLAIDLSHLGLDVDAATCADDLMAIAAALPAGRRIQVGAEDWERADAVLECVLAAAERGYADRLSATVQANLRRSSTDLERFVDAGVHIRLVKGAYVEPLERAWPYGEQTDIAFVRLAHRLAERGAAFTLATHDGVIREALLAALGPVQVEQLFGVRPEVAEELVGRGIPVRVYVPFGDQWFRYWMRRVAESRGA
ncbi:proline dehydrogenase family protein [Solicola gregarius]|uniref:Proline dehydrogenase family protein n=1 Tax=Solicola gregarius TaxID=2908642 RepID=A0AA46TLE8_9ACTN|nr:proline dehydrogenase family protein [Solicola gregarius]UYM07293.1 proline dehydrogenase family protein [Solicola gregarius]